MTNPVVITTRPSPAIAAHLHDLLEYAGRIRPASPPASEAPRNASDPVPTLFRYRRRAPAALAPPAGPRTGKPRPPPADPDPFDPDRVPLAPSDVERVDRAWKAAERLGLGAGVQHLTPSRRRRRHATGRFGPL